MDTGGSRDQRTSADGASDNVVSLGAVRVFRSPLANNFRVKGRMAFGVSISRSGYAFGVVRAPRVILLLASLRIGLLVSVRCQKVARLAMAVQSITSASVAIELR